MPLPQGGDGPIDEPVADADLEDAVYPPDSDVGQSFDVPDDGLPKGFAPIPDYVPEEVEPNPVPVAQDGYAAFDPVYDKPTTVALFDETGEALPEFDPRYRDDFAGLAFIGSLSKQFTWLGHTFIIRTVPTNGLLAIGKITTEYQEGVSGGLAYRTAMAAMCVVSVDGKDLPVPIGPSDSDDDAWAYQRFNYARTHWFQFTIDKINEEYLALETRTAQVVEAMGKAFGPTGSTLG